MSVTEVPQLRAAPGEPVIRKRASSRAIGLLGCAGVVAILCFLSLAIGARVTPPERALDLVRLFLKTEFEGGRHERRLQKVAAIEHGSLAAKINA